MQHDRCTILVSLFIYIMNEKANMKWSIKRLLVVNRPAFVTPQISPMVNTFSGGFSGEGLIEVVM